MAKLVGLYTEPRVVVEHPGYFVPLPGRKDRFPEIFRNVVNKPTRSGFVDHGVYGYHDAQNAYEM